MKNANEGATPEVAHENKGGNCGGRGGRRHSWQWMWLGTQWTNNVRCGTCGEIEKRDRFGHALPKDEQK